MLHTLFLNKTAFPYGQSNCTQSRGDVKHKMLMTEDSFSEAILALQSRLGQTQEGMARLIGCTLGAYSKWVRGERVPGGEWLIKMLQMCPDENSLAAFGVRHHGSDKSPTRAGSPDTHDKNFQNLRTIMASGQLPLIRHAEATLARLAAEARQKARSSKSKK